MEQLYNSQIVQYDNIKNQNVSTNYLVYDRQNMNWPFERFYQFVADVEVSV